MKRRIAAVVIVGAITIILILSFILSVIILTPKEDKIDLDDSKASYIITTSSYVDYQENNDCSAYATAYVLRCLGENTKGKDLYPQMKRFLGMMTVRSIITVVEKQGHYAESYHGNINTLKQRLNSGVPIICLINNGTDSHYVVVVGYDTDYIYLVDSIKENANVTDDVLYNRRVTNNDFISLWKNNFYIVDNVYIVFK